MTDRRIAYFHKRKIDRQMTLDHVASTDGGVHPDGYIIISIMGRNYVPFSPSMNKYAFDEHLRNYIQVNVQGAEVAKHAMAMIDRACGVS